MLNKKLTKLEWNRINVITVGLIVWGIADAIAILCRGKKLSTFVAMMIFLATITITDIIIGKLKPEFANKNIPLERFMPMIWMYIKLLLISSIIEMTLQLIFGIRNTSTLYTNSISGLTIVVCEFIVWKKDLYLNLEDIQEEKEEEDDA